MTRCYNILQVFLRLEADEELISTFDLLYGDFKGETPGHAPSLFLRASTNNNRTRIQSPWGEISCANEEAIVFLMFLMQNHLLRCVREFFAVHAACAALRGRSVVLAGGAGAGKSTLAAELLRRGWVIYSDEVAAIGRMDRRVHVYPRAMALRPATLELVRLPAKHAVTELLLADELKVIVDPGRPEDAVERKPAPVSAVVFLVPPRDEGGTEGAQEVLEVFGPELPDVFFDALNELEDVRRVERIRGKVHPGIRISHRPGSLISARVDEVAAGCNTFLAGHFRGATADIDYSDPPRLGEMAVRKGIERLLGCILNMRSLMVDEGAPKVMFELSQAVDGVRFYELVPGRLKETAELVRTLV